MYGYHSFYRQPGSDLGWSRGSRLGNLSHQRQAAIHFLKSPVESGIPRRIATNAIMGYIHPVYIYIYMGVSENG